MSQISVNKSTLTSKFIEVSLYNALEKECKKKHIGYFDFAENMTLILENYLYWTINNKNINGLKMLFNSISHFDSSEKIGLCSYIARVEYSLNPGKQSQILKIIYDLFPEYHWVMLRKSNFYGISKVKKIGRVIKKYYLGKQRYSFEKTMEIIKMMDPGKTTHYEFYFVMRKDFDSFNNISGYCDIPQFDGQRGICELRQFVYLRRYKSFELMHPTHKYLFSTMSCAILWVGKWFMTWVEKKFDSTDVY